MRRLWFCGVFLASCTVAGAQLSTGERQGVRDALFIGNLLESDLVADRTASKIGLLSSALNRPFEGIDGLLGLNDLVAQRNPAQLLAYLSRDIYGDGTPASPAAAASVPDEIPERLRASVGRLVAEIATANALVRAASEKLGPEQRRMLIEALPRLATDGTVKFEFVKLPMPTESTISTLVSLVDLGAIRRAAAGLSRAVQEEIPRLKEASSGVVLPVGLRLTIEGQSVEITGTGDDVHTSTDTSLCIDLGGNDRYTGRFGAGVGYCSVLIDLGGDDTYDLPDLALGAGVLGIGLAYDQGGDDVVRGKSICLGSGLAGVGLWMKDGGTDEYRSASLGQGFGLFGIGLCIDTKGDDDYRLGAFGQGSAETKGVGWLIDKSGADTYRSGGLVPETRVMNVSLSAAQGCGVGEDAIGGLFDFAGNDLYFADSEGQGYGAEKGLGFLIDADGRDAYQASYGAQAAGERNGGGFLIDLTGDDSYVTRLGNGHAFGHDYGIGFLFDRAGDDLYAGFNSNPGLANANGSALFLDADGDDRYSGSPGVGNGARGSGSLAVFCDLGGTDDYAGHLVDEQAKSDTAWGVALDAVAKAAAGLPVHDPPAAGSKPIGDEATLQSLFARALRNDDKAVEELIAMGEPAVEWLAKTQLARAKPGAISAIAWIATQVGGKSESIIVEKAKGADDLSAAGAIQVCQEARFASVVALLPEALKRPASAAVAARAAGALQVTECVPGLLELVSGTEKGISRIAIIALGQIGDERAFGALQSQVGASDLGIRKAAMAFLAKFGERAMPLAQGLVSSNSERDARIGVELLSGIGSDAAMKEIGSLLADTRRGVQIQALIALDGRCPKEFWGAMVDLRRSLDPLVKAVASRVDTGRGS